MKMIIDKILNSKTDSNGEISGRGTGTRHEILNTNSRFLSEIEKETQGNVSACYQCERCTNACPVSAYMDIKPHEVIRYVQLGWKDELMKSSTIWVCLSCEMCTTYCPNEVLVAETINHLRILAYRSPVEPREKILAEFHHTFVKELQRFGRVNELWLMGALNMKPAVLRSKIESGLLEKEIALGIEMFRKGKLKLLPSRCKELSKVRKIYRDERKGIT